MRKGIRAMGLILVLWIAAGCGNSQGKIAAANPSAAEAAKPAQDSVVIIPVQAEAPERGDISSYFETTARVEAENRVQVMAEGAGECLKVCVEEGDSVKQGDMLAELDKRTIQATIGQTEVQVRQTNTAFDIAERSLAEGIGARAERDNARFAHEQALAALNMQKVQFDKLTLRAPISGIVTKRNIQQGQIVSMGMAVFTVVDPASFMVVIAAPEKELARLKMGQMAKVIIDAIGNEEFDASVRRINPGVDSTSGTVKVTLDFDAAARARLRDSAFARVRLILETHAQALLVPKDALIEENARKYLFVVMENDADVKKPAEVSEAKAGALPEEKQPESAPMPKPETPGLVSERFEVQVGLEDSRHVEILSGIDDQALVVTLGQHTLKTGSHVMVTNATETLKTKLGLSPENALKAAKENRAGQPQDDGGSSRNRHHH